MELLDVKVNPTTYSKFKRGSIQYTFTFRTSPGTKVRVQKTFRELRLVRSQLLEVQERQKGIHHSAKCPVVTASMKNILEFGFPERKLFTTLELGVERCEKLQRCFHQVFHAHHDCQVPHRSCEIRQILTRNGFCTERTSSNENESPPGLKSSRTDFTQGGRHGGAHYKTETRPMLPPEAYGTVPPVLRSQSSTMSSSSTTSNVSVSKRASARDSKKTLHDVSADFNDRLNFISDLLLS